MPVSLPASEVDTLGIDISLPIGQGRLSRGIGLANNVTDPNANTISTGGFFGVMVEDQLPNTTGVIKKVRVAAVNQGLAEILLGAGAVVRGNPLTLDSANRWIVATTGQKVFARAQRDAAAGSYVLALIQNEGTL
jgi:hypothetical protein